MSREEPDGQSSARVELRLPPFLVVDYSPVADARRAALAIGLEPDDIGLKPGVHSGYTFTVHLLKMETIKNPEYELLANGAADGELSTSRDEVIEFLEVDGFPVEDIEHRLNGDAEAFDRKV
jgi:hypothetical protein